MRVYLILKNKALRDQIKKFLPEEMHEKFDKLAEINISAKQDEKGVIIEKRSFLLRLVEVFTIETKNSPNLFQKITEKCYFRVSFKRVRPAISIFG